MHLGRTADIISINIENVKEEYQAKFTSGYCN